MDTPALIASFLCFALPPVTLCYAASCAIWPWKACATCHGTGRIKSPFGRVFRLCRRCDGTGRRIRIGRHVWNEYRRVHRDGHR